MGRAIEEFVKALKFGMAEEGFPDPDLNGEIGEGDHDKILGVTKQPVKSLIIRTGQVLAHLEKPLLLLWQVHMVVGRMN